MNPLMSRLESLVAPALQAENVELVDLAYQKEGGRWIVRFFLDKSGGFNLNDCALWSEKIGQIMDLENPIANPYDLEISSPGIYRVLKKLADFERFLGQRVKIKTFGPIDGARNFTGIIERVDQNRVVIQLDDKRQVSVPFEQIAKANLDPVLCF